MMALRRLTSSGAARFSPTTRKCDLRLAPVGGQLTAWPRGEERESRGLVLLEAVADPGLERWRLQVEDVHAWDSRRRVLAVVAQPVQVNEVVVRGRIRDGRIVDAVAARVAKPGGRTPAQDRDAG